MKITKLKLFTAAILASIPIIVFAHSGSDDGHDFDPVETDFGSYEPGMEPTRTIEVNMSDAMRFTPDSITVESGEIVKFVHTNTGQLMHEFVIGTPDTLAEHAEMMKKFPGMEHSEPYMLHVPPGEEGAIIWKFSKTGEFAFGCLIPGHFDAGMKGVVKVGS